ncbi:hypothetical protein HanRHA438_Chr03g0136771 [Helianthus annuus]|nr:hypothetical protein HanRHA438_Chr03g0136771 [Helianthus annuus]
MASFVLFLFYVFVTGEDSGVVTGEGLGIVLQVVGVVCLFVW